MLVALSFAGARAGIVGESKYLGSEFDVRNVSMDCEEFEVPVLQVFGANEYCQIGSEQHEKQATQDIASMYYMFGLSWTLW